jgi:hypothetical protein
MKRLYFSCFFFLTTTLLSQEPEFQRKIYQAQEVNPHAPTIDGKIDYDSWDCTPLESGFIQIDPVEGDSPSENTSFRICYDDKNLYVLFCAHDSEPDKITARLTRRDDVEDSDRVGIILDSYYDRRTAFEFSANAAGVKYDAVLSNDSYDSADESWDPVWEVATNVNESGWVTEMRIPFNQLRFANKKEHIWGMQVYRTIYRKQEINIWQPMSKNAPGFVSYFGNLEGIRNIHSPKRIELLPYAVSKLNTYEIEQGNPFSTGRNGQATGGLDGKIGLAGDLTLDFTINPDFGQVEADPSEVNLTVFETFFPERRPFFIEGKNIFQFPLAIGDGDFARETLFYSRRIGRHPQHEPEENDDVYIKMPEYTSILGAAKISGKTAGGWSIGVLNAMTAEEIAQIDSNGFRREEVVEPLTNYFVGRLQKDYDAGNTYIGGLVTATNRKVDQSYLKYINHSAYSGGIDFTHQWKNKTYFVQGKASFSHVRGHEEAILEVQTSSTRYFQRPDADYVSLDSSRTSLGGHGGSIDIGRQGNGRWRYILGGIWRSPGYELNDIGYLMRADLAMQYIWVGYRIANPVGIFQQISINANQYNAWNFGGEGIFNGSNVNGGGIFKNYWGFWLGLDREIDGLSIFELRGGPALRIEGGWNNWYSINTDSRKKIHFELNGFNYWSDDKISRYRNLSMSIIYKPSNGLLVSLSPWFEINKKNLQYVDTVDKNGEDRYIMAHIDQNTFGLVFRLNYSITPNLSIQYYGQPFVSAGQYTQYKRITNPRAVNYKDRFQIFDENEIYYSDDNGEYLFDENQDGNIDYTIESPDFNFKQYRSNLVIRWEYRPGSQIYLVWSQESTGEDDYGDFQFRRDLKNLYNTSPNNIFLIKLNYWFSM